MDVQLQFRMDSICDKANFKSVVVAEENSSGEKSSTLVHISRMTHDSNTKAIEQTCYYPTRYVRFALHSLKSSEFYRKGSIQQPNKQQHTFIACLESISSSSYP